MEVFHELKITYIESMNRFWFSYGQKWCCLHIMEIISLPSFELVGNALLSFLTICLSSVAANAGQLLYADAMDDLRFKSSINKQIWFQRESLSLMFAQPSPNKSNVVKTMCGEIWMLFNRQSLKQTFCYSIRLSEECLYTWTQVQKITFGVNWNEWQGWWTTCPSNARCLPS